MAAPIHLRLDLTTGVAEQYIKYSKTKGELIIIDKLCDLLTVIKAPENDNFTDNFKWTKPCIWQSIYINYHKLFSDPMKSGNGEKISKFQINAKDFLKDASAHLVALHEKILLVRHEYFVHGGTELHENYTLHAAVTVFPGHGSKIQLNIEGTKKPDIDDSDIVPLKELVTHLMSKLEEKLAKTTDKINETLHIAIEEIDAKIAMDNAGD